MNISIYRAMTVDFSVMSIVLLLSYSNITSGALGIPGLLLSYYITITISLHIAIIITILHLCLSTSTSLSFYIYIYNYNSASQASTLKLKGC